MTDKIRGLKLLGYNGSDGGDTATVAFPKTDHAGPVCVGKLIPELSASTIPNKVLESHPAVYRAIAQARYWRRICKHSGPEFPCPVATLSG